MTGTGRSELFKRVMAIIAPKQVFRFSASEACGWLGLTHVQYLHIDFSSNGSRAGLLHRILLALDQVTGTSFSDDLKRVTNIDVLLMHVYRELSNVRCALLAIDEKQGSNFNDSPWKPEFLLFYLSLMNLGINVVLLGNPLAFKHLTMFSQVMRRFSSGGIHSFLPALHATDAWWEKDFMPRMREFSLVEEYQVDTAWRNSFEHSNNGGLPGLAAALHGEVQITAIRRAGASPSVVVTDKDYLAAIKSPTYTELKAIALAVRGNAGASEPRHYLDIPELPTRPSATAGQNGSSKTFPTINEPTLSVVKQLIARYSRKSANKSKKFIKSLESVKGLDADDLRMLGVSQDHLAEMNKLVERLPGGKPKAKVPKKG